MQEQMSSTDQDPDWDHIRPVLDSVMSELKAPDREALLLRFFERRTLAELGDKLGLNENAARKRVERALQRMQDLLARRGITSTAATLALVLTQHTTAAVPAGLAASITAATLASATTSGGLQTTAGPCTKS